MIRSIIAVVFIGIAYTNDIKQDVHYLNENVLNDITKQEDSPTIDDLMHTVEAEDERAGRYKNNPNEGNDERRGMFGSDRRNLQKRGTGKFSNPEPELSFSPLSFTTTFKLFSAINSILH